MTHNRPPDPGNLQALIEQLEMLIKALDALIDRASRLFCLLELRDILEQIQSCSEQEIEDAFVAVNAELEEVKTDIRTVLTEMVDKITAYFGASNGWTADLFDIELYSCRTLSSYRAYYNAIRTEFTAVKLLMTFFGTGSSLIQVGLQRMRSACVCFRDNLNTARPDADGDQDNNDEPGDGPDDDLDGGGGGGN